MDLKLKIICTIIPVLIFCIVLSTERGRDYVMQPVAVVILIWSLITTLLSNIYYFVTGKNKPEEDKASS